jgi:5-methyltetrahydropteroyltriglutamate--homocysteine methyltransferase
MLGGRSETPRQAERAVSLLGAERVLLNPDCGFATFADNPIVGPKVAEAKLAALVRARDLLRDGHPNLG